MPKVLCPYHADTAPSMEVYPDRLYCFVCRASVSHEAYAKASGQRVVAEPVERVKEDLQASMAYIKALPKMRIRGLDLPADSHSYFIVWPEGNYYHRRFFDTEAERGKYKCPAGWPKPLFIASPGIKGRTLLIVEGEINALSIRAAVPDIAVCSPGGAGDFASANGLKSLPYYLSFQRQVLVADEDAAGAMACIELGQHLRA